MTIKQTRFVQMKSFPVVALLALLYNKDYHGQEVRCQEGTLCWTDKDEIYNALKEALKDTPNIDCRADIKPGLIRQDEYTARDSFLHSGEGEEARSVCAKILKLNRSYYANAELKELGFHFGKDNLEASQEFGNFKIVVTPSERSRSRQEARNKLEKDNGNQRIMEAHGASTNYPYLLIDVIKMRGQLFSMSHTVERFEIQSRSTFYTPYCGVTYHN